MNSPSSRTRLFSRAAVPLTLLLALVCTTPSRAVAPPSTLLADKPIAAGADVPGNLALALSVEFPTAISIANLGDYNDTTQWIGYFDSAKCYTYQFDSAFPEHSYFKPTSNGLVSGGKHDCSPSPGQWSGNFLNWIATQTIDPFRGALTGGYRSYDTANMTILEKAYGSAQGSAPANFPYRGTSQGGGNFLNTSGSTIQKLTPFNTWSQFDAGVWGNGKTMVFSGGGGGSGYTLPYNSGSVSDLSNLAAANTSSAANNAYRVYIRVSVCDPSLGVALLESNCVQYGTNYKPEGLLQQYSQKIRFSAFGYLTQGGDVREGGALRAPMGFIGPNIPVPFSTVPAANPKPEWDPITGIMNTNPDTASASAPNPVVSQSGVMNYLNKFGEATQNYKTYDNVSELYYAAVRYYENLGDVPEWTNGDAPYLDGFPAVTNWTDPILYTCQKNFILGIGDDHTWYDYDVGGNTNVSGGRPMPAAVASDPINHASLWTTELQNIEGIAPTPIWPFDTQATYFIAGLAYGVHVNDIRPDLAHTQTISTYWMDVAEGQHLESLNPYYLASKYGGFNAGTINATPYVPVTNPAYDMTQSISAGLYNSTGLFVPWSGPTRLMPDNYYNAGNASAMVAGLTSAFANISNSISSLSTSFSFSLPNVSTAVQSFGAGYDANGWAGTVTGFSLTFDGFGNPTQVAQWCTTTPCLAPAPTAGTLNTQLAGNLWQTARRVVTWNGTAGVPFEAANLTGTSTSGQVGALNTLAYAPGITCTTSICPYLDYLRGDQSNEVSAAAGTHSFRDRKSLLGDIVDAGLVPVATPLQTFSDANNPGYIAFKNHWTAPTAPLPRPTTVYVGANDGMLHAFDGATGTEVFAYVPSALFQGPNGTPQVDGLAQLGNPTYVHHNYVDATPAAFDVDMAHIGSPPYGLPDWHTVLIGGLGKGGKSYYALDITDPASMGTGATEASVAGKVLWEFTDPTMGYSYGTPVVVKTVKYGWVVILTSGYDNADGFGYLYIVNPQTGALLQPPIKTPSPSSGMTQASAFVKDFSDETADSVYVGDLGGQVWRFDLRGPTAIPPPVLLATVTDGSATPQPQPITTAPLIEIHPVTRQRYVLFGTGQLLAVTDLPSQQMQSFYAIIDGTASGFNVVSVPITRANLTPITDAQLNLPNPVGGGLAVNTLVAGSVGWYTDLGQDLPKPPGSGIAWRVILNPQAFNGIVTFATSLTTATDPCSPQGSSRVYAIDYATVDSVLQPTIAGNPIPSFDAFSDSAINLRFTGAHGNPEIIVGFSVVPPEKVPASLTSLLATRILNWREVPTVE
jgi:type IV pilus assembly protein PilY1